MKKKTNFSLKNVVTSKCERNIPFGTKFRYISYPQKGFKKTMPFGVPANPYMGYLRATTLSYWNFSIE